MEDAGVEGGLGVEHMPATPIVSYSGTRIVEEGKRYRRVWAAVAWPLNSPHYTCTWSTSASYLLQGLGVSQ